MDCKYKVNIKNIQYNYKVRLAELQEKYKFNLFCTGGKYDDTEIREEIASLEEENEYLNSIVDQLPKVKVEGEHPALDNTLQAKMKVDLKGNTSQFSTTGKNLLNNITTNGTVNGITFTKNSDGSVTANGTATVDTYKPINTFSFESGTSYKMTGCPSGGTSSTYFLTLNSSPYSTDFGNGVTISTASGNIQVSIGIKSGTTVNNLKFYPMIRLSSITDYTYEPYTGGIPAPNPSYPYPVNVVTGNNSINVVGKNLFDKDSPNIIANKYLDENGVLQNATRSSVSDYMKVLSNTVYSIQPYRMVSQRLCFYDKNKTFISSQSLASINPSFTTPSNCEYIRASFITEDIDIWQLEKGSTATIYTPYTSQTYPINLGSIELCKIGDYQDYIYKDNGKWYKYGIIGKIILNGSENWSRNSFQNKYYYRLETTIPKQTNGYANYFTIIAYSESVLNYTNTIRINDNQIDVVLDKSNISLNDFKTWLNTHNITVYYVLATPTTTEITDSTLISQLEALKEAESYLGQTNISQVNNDAPFIIDATALYDLNNLITRVAILETE